MKRIRIAHALFLTLVTIVFMSCTSDTDDRGRGPRSYPGAGEGGGRPGGFARASAGDGLDTMPPADWWRDPKISVAVGLSADQIASLDRVSHEQAEEIAKLERDSMVAARELREMFDTSQPAAADIIAAGQRMRGIRDALFDRRVQMFAAERTLLTQQQWQTLLQQIAANNRPDRGERGNGPRGGRGGRGGMGGRGRFPG
ncbi:MAG TPA: hypothetical protein VHX14_17090 [Thermoanaerobaculia bacterium]|jgi:hypothetical protein|nr:hypothetical protein [Thermoanaerobaculia bacterium]